MTLLAFLMAAGWRPNPNHQIPHWPLWLAVALFYAAAFAAILWESQQL